MLATNWWVYHCRCCGPTMTDLNDALPAPAGGGPLLARTEAALKSAVDRLLGAQQADGHWVYVLEADATIASEYILLRHFLGEIEGEAFRADQTMLTGYIRGLQAEHGGWPLFFGGAFDMSASVKAYFALKCAGDSPDAPHMTRARQAILAHGGAARSNVFTRIQLALFGAVPWRAVPTMPVEIMLLPRWFPFHLSKVSYWSRTVLVPLLILMTLKPQARNPTGTGIAELFATPPEHERDWHSNPNSSALVPIFRAIDAVLRAAEPLMPKAPRRRAIDKALAFIEERLNGQDGLGAIYPAMANAVMAYDALGLPPDDPRVATARAAVAALITRGPDKQLVQPCVSPIWDTALACHALLEAGGPKAALHAAGDWLRDRQVLDVVGDWAEQRPGVRPGGWPFQYANPHYPDLDDTAVVVMALDRLDPQRYREAIERGAEWVLGLQSKNGGWGAFDADNTHEYLNHIPFADHGALLDQPSSDVTGRCLGMLAQLGYKKDHPAVVKALDFLRREQEADGSWFGRWGTNYVYGTWSVLSAYNAIGVDMDGPDVRKAVDWLVGCQREDGGWGESCSTYWREHRGETVPESSASQTAWAVLALMAAGEVDHPAVERGIAYLTRTQKDDGSWDERYYNAVGFPRVFYLHYHGYRAYFPMWSIARYRNLKSGNSARVMHGL